MQVSIHCLGLFGKAATFKKAAKKNELIKKKSKCIPTIILQPLLMNKLFTR